MKSITFDGMTFGREEIEANRKQLIELRDAALLQADFHWSVVLSHTVAILAHLIKEIDE